MEYICGIKAKKGCKKNDCGLSHAFLSEIHQQFKNNIDPEEIMCQNDSIRRIPDFLYLPQDETVEQRMPIVHSVWILCILFKGFIRIYIRNPRIVRNQIVNCRKQEYQNQNNQ